MIKNTLRALAIVATALALTACGGWVPDLAKSWGGSGGVATATVDMTELSKKSHQARIAYLAFVQTATAYARRPRCGGTVIVCSDQAFLDGVVTPTVRSFGDATKASEDAVTRLGSNPTLVAALVEAAVSSARAADKVAANFK